MLAIMPISLDTWIIGLEWRNSVLTFDSFWERAWQRSASGSLKHQRVSQSAREMSGKVTVQAVVDRAQCAKHVQQVKDHKESQRIGWSIMRNLLWAVDSRNRIQSIQMMKAFEDCPWRNTSWKCLEVEVSAKSSLYHTADLWKASLEWTRNQRRDDSTKVDDVVTPSVGNCARLTSWYEDALAV